MHKTPRTKIKIILRQQQIASPNCISRQFNFLLPTDNNLRNLLTQSFQSNTLHETLLKANKDAQYQPLAVNSTADFLNESKN